MSYDSKLIRSCLVDPLDVANRLGLISGRRSYKRLSNGLLACCIWHQERSPSMSITRGPDGTLRAHCFACGGGGDVFSLIAKANNLDVHREFGAVLQIAAGLAGIDEETTQTHVVLPPLPPEEPRLDDETFDRLARVIEERCPLRRQPDVCRYLADRGLLEAAGTSIWALPPNDEGLSWVRDCIIAEIGRDAWEISGLADPDDLSQWHCRRNRLCLPWRDPNGVVQTIQRRLIFDGRPKYIFPARRPARWPFGSESLATKLGPATEIAFVEGSLDVIAMHALCRRDGIDRVALGLPGTSSWNMKSEWTQVWAKLCAGRQVVLALDNDDAGEAAAQKIAKDLWAAGACSVDRSVPSGLKDWGELAARRAS